MIKITTIEELQTLLDKNDITGAIVEPLEQEFLTDDIYVRFYLCDINKPIIVAFTNAGETTTEEKLKNPNYAPWGYDFIKNEGYNVVSISCYQNNNWYRTPLTQNIIKVFSQYIRPFQQKLGYGGSMGGYAVGAYCDILNLDRCLLFNPISTLNPTLVPFEDRFDSAAKDYSWNSEYHDGSLTKTPKLIVVDPLFKHDKLHAYRYQNAQMINFRGVGHGIPGHLLVVKALRDSFYCLINNTLPTHEFYKKIRDGKRRYNHYFKFITGEHIKQLTPKRKEVIKKFHHDYLNRLESPTQKKIDNNNTIRKTEPTALKINTDDINTLRDLAVKLEKTDLKASLDLMSIAQKLRPNGPFINKKVKEYQERLKN